MTLRHMRIFQKIYETQSVTRAAEALHMTQPAVTRALQELEKYYGLRLFERLNRRLTVTEAGRRMYDYALHLTETFDTMEKSLRDWERQGVLRVGASVSLGCSLLPQLARTFQEEHPGVEVRVRIANGELLRRDLLENRLDLALLEGEENGADLMLTPFAAGEMALIVPPGHPLARAGGRHPGPGGGVSAAAAGDGQRNPALSGSAADEPRACGAARMGKRQHAGAAFGGTGRAGDYAGALGTGAPDGAAGGGGALPRNRCGADPSPVRGMASQQICDGDHARVCQSLHGTGKERIKI